MVANQTRLKLDTLLNELLSSHERAHAARYLGHLGAEDVASALLAIAQDAAEDDDVSRAAGKSLARMYIRHGNIDDAPLHTFSGPAYLGFDETIAACQHNVDLDTGADVTNAAPS